MIIHESKGNLRGRVLDNVEVDFVDLEWFEMTKKIQRKKTRNGRDIAIKFLKEGQQLRQDDVLFEDGNQIIAVNILECDAIVIEPDSMLAMGTVCYEIGNKHIPLFIQDDKVLLPFENPMFRWLEASGYKPIKDHVKLLNLLKSNVTPHGHGSVGSSLFTKILKMASNE